MAFLRLRDVDVEGKRVFIRADFNVPQDEHGTITDDTRIRAALPGIRDCLARGAAVMVTSHLGRPAEGAWSAADSLAPVARRLSELLGSPVPLVRDWVDGGAWHEVFPDDGIADSTHERYSLDLALAGSGEHTISLRAFDTNSNVGTFSLTVRR